MDVSVSALVFLSAIYGEKMRRNGQWTNSSKSDETDGPENTSAIENPSKGTELKLPQYLLFNFTYFAAMGLTVVILQYYPSVMIILQHVAVVSFIMIAFAQWLPLKMGYSLGILFGALWLLSVETEFRWIINNVIIAMFAFLASHVQFRNFAFLQIFLWTALVYDVCLLARMNETPQVLSVGECGNLLCQLFEMNSAWELPSVFTVRFGENQTHVFLGTGDIIIGAIVANFAMSFFKSPRCLLGVVASYSTAIAFLSQVDTNKPYPALISIVPMCSVSLVGCAVVCKKTKRLFSLTSKESSDLRDEDILLI
ncbi:hypothetical protein OS493_017211 [Desmophyllum pertusum]|uniref:Uncharacterized protein n=1 Tax=Desmophyllum pertusum TaxID=174260 RepID=A0A9W9YFV5_9CNID|nr:hypothetical protein OS493_017211 [Desmophyllum pertusum]